MVMEGVLLFSKCEQAAHSQKALAQLRLRRGRNEEEEAGGSTAI
jgi:hypothetical protein